MGHWGIIECKNVFLYEADIGGDLLLGHDFVSEYGFLPITSLNALGLVGDWGIKGIYGSTPLEPILDRGNSTTPIPRTCRVRPNSGPSEEYVCPRKLPVGLVEGKSRPAPTKEGSAEPEPLPGPRCLRRKPHRPSGLDGADPAFRLGVAALGYRKPSRIQGLVEGEGSQCDNPQSHHARLGAIDPNRTVVAPIRVLESSEAYSLRTSLPPRRWAIESSDSPVGPMTPQVTQASAMTTEEALRSTTQASAMSIEGALRSTPPAEAEGFKSISNPEPQGAGIIYDMSRLVLPELRSEDLQSVKRFFCQSWEDPNLSDGSAEGLTSESSQSDGSEEDGHPLLEDSSESEDEGGVFLREVVGELKQGSQGFRSGEEKPSLVGAPAGERTQPCRLSSLPILWHVCAAQGWDFPVLKSLGEPTQLGAPLQKREWFVDFQWRKSPVCTQPVGAQADHISDNVPSTRGDGGSARLTQMLQRWGASRPSRATSTQKKK
uniref:Uncharacterized protein n=1 Tax=Eutreptiella gymnastica TaxID=73025 RepID=A0A7S1JEV5_9EUGL